MLALERYYLLTRAIVLTAPNWRGFRAIRGLGKSGRKSNGKTPNRCDFVGPLRVVKTHIDRKSKHGRGGGVRGREGKRKGEGVVRKGGERGGRGLTHGLRDGWLGTRLLGKGCLEREL